MQSSFPSTPFGLYCFNLEKYEKIMTMKNPKVEPNALEAIWLNIKR